MNDNDTLARARRVVAGMVADERHMDPAPWEWRHVRAYHGTEVKFGECDECDDGPGLVALRNAAPALLALAEAVGRLAATRHDDGDLWWLYLDDGIVPVCKGCGESGSPTMRVQDLEHAPDCPALAIDAALADLAALADDAGEVGA